MILKLVIDAHKNYKMVLHRVVLLVIVGKGLKDVTT
jgi:hypothetical protein